MNKSELAAAAAEKTGQSKKTSEQTVDAVLQVIMEELANGGKVRLVGFGTFETRNRAERMGRNPKTLEKILIPTTIAPIFKAGQNFKDAVNKNE